MGMTSGWHLMILGFVLLLLFGNRLPSVMRNIGAGFGELKKGLDSSTEPFREIDKTAQDVTKELKK